MNNGLSALITPSKGLLVVLMLLTGVSITKFSMGDILRFNVIYNIFLLFKDIIMFIV
jgi:hypothetical protein